MTAGIATAAAAATAIAPAAVTLLLRVHMFQKKNKIQGPHRRQMFISPKCDNDSFSLALFYSLT